MERGVFAGGRNSGARRSQSRQSRSPLGLDVDATGSSPLTGVVLHLRTLKHLGNDVRRHSEVGCGEPFDGGPKLDEARTVGLLKHPEGADDGEARVSGHISTRPLIHQDEFGREFAGEGDGFALAEVQ